MQENEIPQIDLNRFRNHRRSIPWGLIRKLLIGIGTVLLLYYFMNRMDDQSRKETHEKDAIEVDVEF